MTESLGLFPRVDEHGQVPQRGEDIGDGSGGGHLAQETPGALGAILAEVWVIPRELTHDFGRHILERSLEVVRVANQPG